MQVLDSLVDGPLELANEREGNELIGMVVRYLRTGREPSPRTDAQRMALSMVRPVLEKSRARIVAGSRGGAVRGGGESGQEGEPPSKAASKTESKTESTVQSEMESKGGSDIYSSSSTPLPGPTSGEGCGEGDPIPYGEIVGLLNEAAGTGYRASSKATRRLIRARWAEGYRLGDFAAVVSTMAAEWGGDPKMSAYLRPETLFGTKFEGYLNRRGKKGAADDPFAAY